MHKRIAIAAALLLAGCATLDPTYYQRQSTAQICHGLMTLPAFNVNHPARWAELQRRGESCGHPLDIAAAQQRANDNAAAMIMQGAAILSTPAPRPVTCSRVGPTVTCF
jgi:hypothetical protein